MEYMVEKIKRVLMFVFLLGINVRSTSVKYHAYEELLEFLQMNALRKIRL